MNIRQKYTLLYTLPGFFIAYWLTWRILGFITAMFFFFSPISLDEVTVPFYIVLVLVFILILSVIVGVGYRHGKRVEFNPINYSRDLKVSIVITSFFVLIIIVFQVYSFSAKNKTTTIFDKCNVYCKSKGFEHVLSGPGGCQCGVKSLGEIEQITEEGLLKLYPN